MSAYQIILSILFVIISKRFSCELEKFTKSQNMKRLLSICTRLKAMAKRGQFTPNVMLIVIPTVQHH